ncbi:MAG: hypothetical protein HFI37_06035 [Lachnospiraceae bacterium]|nr:hypothetical protein [Lachnospiraceae bacterium]
MDYHNKEPWFYMQQNHPLYMPYPIQMQGNYLNEMEYEKDLDRMKELYPKEAKRIQKYIDEECDRMEYEGSLMFDEYPDRTMLQIVCRNIMDKIQEDEEKEDNIEASEYRKRSSRGDGLSNLIEVLLYNEMYKRRCRRRRCNRWW